jgi:phosphohistidine phosphatase
MPAMRLLVIRHAHAAPQQPGVPDAERPLTSDGARRFRAAAHGIATLVTPDVLVASPLRRAQETAAIAAAIWGGIQPATEAALASGSVEAILTALEHHPPAATVAVIGHEPSVSALVAELVGARSTEALAFEPGAAALLELPSLAARHARLVWFLPPGAASALGDRPPA